jgi:hypothetical protein
VAKILTFDGLADNEHTFFTDLDTGAMVQVAPGAIVPVRKVDDYQQYIDRGMATLSGEEDGGDGQLDKIADGLRAILAEVAPLDGDQAFWTLDEMLEQIASIQEADTTAKEVWADNALNPMVTSVTPADRTDNVPAGGPFRVDLNVPIYESTLTATNCYSLLDESGNASDRTVESVEGDEDLKGASLTLDDDLTPGLVYRLRVAGLNAETGRAPMLEPFVQEIGFRADTRPAVSSTSPASGADNVAIDVAVTVNFDKSMSTVSATLYDVTAESSASLSLSPTDGDARDSWASEALSLIDGHHYKIRVAATGTVSSNEYALAEDFEQEDDFHVVD